MNRWLGESGSASPGGGGTNVGVIDPRGQFLCVIDRTANTLYGFQIQQSAAGATPFGSLQAIPNGVPFSGSGFTLNAPSWVMTDRTGQFLYVLNAGDNTISGFLINTDGSVGPIIPLSPLPPTGNGPVYGTTDTNGYMYVANSSDNSVTAYQINSDGTWQSSGTLSVSGATSIVNVLIDPKGQFLYVLDRGGASGGQVFANNLIPPCRATYLALKLVNPSPWVLARPDLRLIPAACCWR